ncbi:MAG: PIN domain-containing protein [Cyanobacteria bacterium P01_F01_bin.150]
MNLVCFDTQILIWGVKQQATPGQEANIEKARHLIQMCDENNIRVIVPSIVVAELLCNLPKKIHNDFRQLMQNRFIVSPFDTQAALHFANMWQSRSTNRGGISRSEMKADFMIIAIALAHKAECIYSEDDGLTKFAKDYILVKPLPIVTKQLPIKNFDQGLTD